MPGEGENISPGHKPLCITSIPLRTEFDSHYIAIARPFFSRSLSICHKESDCKGQHTVVVDRALRLKATWTGSMPQYHEIIRPDDNRSRLEQAISMLGNVPAQQGRIANKQLSLMGHSLANQCASTTQHSQTNNGLGDAPRHRENERQKLEFDYISAQV